MQITITVDDNTALCIVGAAKEAGVSVSEFFRRAVDAQIIRDIPEESSYTKYHRRYQERHKSQINAYARKWRAKNKERINASRRKKRNGKMKKYPLTKPMRLCIISSQGHNRCNKDQ